MKIFKRLILILAILALAAGFQTIPATATTVNLTQILSGSIYAFNAVTLPNYTPLLGGNSSITNSFVPGTLFPQAGTLRDFRIELSAPPGSGLTRTFTIQKNGVSTSLAVSISGASATQGSDTANTISLVAGDYVKIYSTKTGSGSPAGCDVYISATFESAVSNQTDSLIMGSWKAASPITNGYSGLDNPTIDSYTAGTMSSVMPAGGTLKNFYFRSFCQDNAATVAMKLYVNGAEQLSGTLPAPDAVTKITTYNDTSSTVTVAAGDLVSFSFLNAGLHYGSFGLTFVSNVPGQYLVMGHSIAVPSTSVANYYPFVNPYDRTVWADPSRSKSGYQDPGYAGVQFGNLYLNIQTAPGAGKSYDYTMLQDGNSTGLTVQIAGTDTTASDTSHTWTLTGGDYFNQLTMNVLPTGTPTAPTAIRWGVTATIYKTPQVTTTAATAVKDTYATMNANITLLVNGNATERGFYYDTTSHPGSSFTGTYAYSLSETGSYATGTYALTPTTLVKNTTYYFRAYAVDSVGTGYSTVELTFTTLNPQGTATSLGMAIIGGATPSGTYDSGISVYSVKNIGTCAMNVTLQGFDATGGVGWALADDGSVGTDTYAMYAGTSTYDVVVRKTAPFNAVVTNLAPGDSASFGVEVKTPSVMGDQVTKNTSIAVLYVAY